MKATKLLDQNQAAALAGWTARRLRQVQDEDASVPRAVDPDGRLLGYPPDAFGPWLRARYAKEMCTSQDGETLDPQQEKALLDREPRQWGLIGTAIN